MIAIVARPAEYIDHRNNPQTQYHVRLAAGSMQWRHLLTPGAATEGVTPLFFLKNLATFFSRQFCGVTPDFFAKTDDLFLLIALSLFIAFTRVSPPRGCHPHLFYLSDLVSPLIFVNLPTKKFFLEGVTRGGPPSPPLVTPLGA